MNNDVIFSLLDRLEDRFLLIYDKIIINDKMCFLLPSGSVVHLVCFPEDGWRCILAEFADSIEEAEKNLFEDGDLLFINDFTEEELYQSLLKEIEES